MWTHACTEHMHASIVVPKENKYAQNICANPCMYISFIGPLYGREEQYHEVKNPPEKQNKFT